jgi:cytochrome c oxidase cbb3-type subunit I
MSASIEQSQIPSSRADVVSAASNDFGRAPVIFLFTAAAFWLCVSSLFALIASLKFHAPGFLGNSAWTTYGRIYPAYWNALIYGFAIPSGMAVCLALLSRIGGSRVMLSGLATVGALVWNLGVLLGVAGILHGDSTGFEWLEIPRYASPILFLGYALIGISALVTSSHRRIWELSIAQWFFIAAIFWFPWIFSTANLLLVFVPARGVVQAIINWWFINNLKVWFSLVGLGIIFHLVPTVLGRPIYDRAVALFSFWMFLFVAPWTGIPNGAPIPSWIPAVSTVATFVLLIPVAAIVMNIGKTIAGDCTAIRGNFSLRFLQWALLLWAISILVAALSAIPQVAAVVNFTWIEPAIQRVVVIGFFALTIFGAAYDILPRSGTENFMCPKAARLQFICAIVGILLVFGSLAVTGVVQGFQLTNPGVPVAQVSQKWLMPFRFSTLGEVLILVASACFMANILRVCRGCCRECCVRKSEVT